MNETKSYPHFSEGCDDRQEELSRGIKAGYRVTAAVFDQMQGRPLKK